MEAAGFTAALAGALGAGSTVVSEGLSVGRQRAREARLGTTRHLDARTVAPSGQRFNVNNRAKMSEKPQKQVRLIEVSEAEAGQRLDNFIARYTVQIPKSRIYRAIRKGEVRVNKGRARPESRVAPGDLVRIPPFTMEESVRPGGLSAPWRERILSSIILDNDQLLALNKPTGLAVHGGSGVRLGLIESLREIFPAQRYLELVHRLDRDTSGLVLIAKRASALRELHAQLRADGVDKRYLALVTGKWPSYLRQVEAPLSKSGVQSGERIVRVQADGKSAQTQFRVLERFKQATLVEAKPVTGRTHQIRVHAQHAGHPILGDSKYQSPQSEALEKTCGLRRLFLHAAHLDFRLAGERYRLDCPIDDELESVLALLREQR